MTDGGAPPTGPYDLRFNLYDAAAGGAQVGATLFRDDVSVAAGLFTVSLDFGASAFAGGARWLEVAVRPGASGGAYSALSPRQELTPSPNAVFSSTAPWAGVSGKPAGFADDIDNDSGGDITAVTAGAGLTGGATSGAATVAVSFGASGVATTAARSDHDHFGQAWTGADAGPGLRVNNSGGGAILGVSTFPDGNGVHGRSSATTGFGWGVFGESPSPDGAGVSGYGTATSGHAEGVLGVTSSPVGRGVSGVALSSAGSSFGVRGESPSPIGFGVAGYGRATSGSATGVLGLSLSPTGHGVRGSAASTTGTNYGVRGSSASPDGVGVLGEATASTGGNRGVIGTTNSSGGIGVLGKTYASGSNFGVVGATDSPAGIGVFGTSEAASGVNYGVYGVSSSTSGRAVFGWATAGSGTTFGVYGVASSPAGYAGYFDGSVHVSGTLSKAGGSFKIDHPLDPENKYLYHSFVESPDMMNVYNGNAVMGDDGSATVELPEWFEALNRDFRYQLTAIGGPGPNLHVAEEVQANRFRIAGGTAGLRVSWQVTGIRQDAFAEKHRIPVEEDKPEGERGKYLHPAARGLPAERGLDRERRPKLEAP